MTTVAHRARKRRRISRTCEPKLAAIDTTALTLPPICSASTLRLMKALADSSFHFSPSQFEAGLTFAQLASLSPEAQEIVLTRMFELCAKPCHDVLVQRLPAGTAHLVFPSSCMHALMKQDPRRGACLARELGCVDEVLRVVTPLLLAEGESLVGVVPARWVISALQCALATAKAGEAYPPLLHVLWATHRTQLGEQAAKANALETQRALVRQTCNWFMQRGLDMPVWIGSHNQVFPRGALRVCNVLRNHVEGELTLPAALKGCHGTPREPHEHFRWERGGARLLLKLTLGSVLRVPVSAILIDSAASHQLQLRAVHVDALLPTALATIVLSYL